MTLAERVSEAIEAAKKNGHSVAMIAAACGITDQAVYQWASGDSKEINGSNLAELAELSGYRPLWIMKEKGNKTDEKEIQAAVKLMRKLPTGDRVMAVRIIGGLLRTDGEPAAVETEGVVSPKKARASDDSPLPIKPVTSLFDSAPVENTKVAIAYSDKKVPRLVAKYTTPTLWEESQNPNATEDD